jgi:hypothetical protein
VRQLAHRHTVLIALLTRHIRTLLLLLQAEARWRQELAAGSLLDCLDSTGTWLNAEVLAVRDSVPAPFILAGAPSPLHSSSFAVPDMLSPAHLMDTGSSTTAGATTATAFAVTGTAAGERTAEHTDASDEPPPLVQCDSPMWDSNWGGIDDLGAAAASAAKSAPRVTVQSVAGDAPLQPMDIQIDEVLEAEELSGTGFATAAAAAAGTVREVLVAFRRRATAGVSAEAVAVEAVQPAPELNSSTDDSSSSSSAAVPTGWPIAAAVAAGEAESEWVAVDSHRLQLLHSRCYASNAQLPEEPVNDTADSSSPLSGEQCCFNMQ